jgi:16S rRNA (guanine527-N7)-methyltransferase
MRNGEADFVQKVPVSRETLDRLRCYVDLLEKWNRRINLVAPATLPAAWTRHLLDSAQLFALLPPAAGTLIDLGSGAGLPGLILAILGIEDVHLVESDTRKAVFLQEAARMTGTKVTIHPRRIEAMPPLSADLITARAVAPLPALLDYATRFLRPGGACYFLKGATVSSELTEAQKSWHMVASLIPSRSEAAGVIVKLEQITRERHS